MELGGGLEGVPESWAGAAAATIISATIPAVHFHLIIRRPLVHSANFSKYAIYCTCLYIKSQAEIALICNGLITCPRQSKGGIKNFRVGGWPTLPHHPSEPLVFPGVALSPQARLQAFDLQPLTV